MSQSAPSLWSLIAPFDHHGQFVSGYLWPLLSDEDAMEAMRVNAATLAWLPFLTPRHAFTMNELPKPSSVTRHLPRISRLLGFETGGLAAALARLPHVTALSLTVRQLSSEGKWTVQLPPSLTQLHLTVSAQVWRWLRTLPLPSALCELTVDGNVSKERPTESVEGPLPPHVHTAHIRSSRWQWRSFQQLHLTADSTQLRSLSIVDANYYAINKVDGSLLPRSLTLLDLSDSSFDQPLSVFHLPKLVTLRLGSADQSVRRGFSADITAESFAGLPVLRELDMRWALSFGHTLLPGALPDSLTSLSLPIDYRPHIVAGGCRRPSSGYGWLMHARMSLLVEARAEASSRTAACPSVCCPSTSSACRRGPGTCTHYLSHSSSVCCRLRSSNCACSTTDSTRHCML